MKYFLAKSEPSTYSIDDIQRDKETTWDGVKNPTARIVIKSMKPGDRIFFYHSGECRIVGLIEVVSEPRDDPKFPKRSSVLDVKFLAKFSDEDCITLKEIKDSNLYNDWELVRISRLFCNACYPRNSLNLQG